MSFVIDLLILFFSYTTIIICINVIPSYFLTDGQEDTSATESVRPGNASGRTTPQPKGSLKASEVESGNDSTMKTAPSPSHSKGDAKEKPSAGTLKDIADKGSTQTTPRHLNVPPKPARRLSADGAATRTSLDHTITVIFPFFLIFRAGNL